jgi:hypothetical protein
VLPVHALDLPQAKCGKTDRQQKQKRGEPEGPPRLLDLRPC